MSTAVHLVDAFTDRPFAGNPAAVCLLANEAEPAWMHAVAAELNLPKTAFLRRDVGGSFHLRWFGVDGESQLCGHATLAAAHVLWDSGAVRPEECIAFQTVSGGISAQRLPDGWIEIDFPAEVATEESQPEVLAALGVEALWMGRNRLHFVVEVASEAIVRGLQPDFRQLRQALASARGVVVTARATGGDYDIVSRHFAPPAGIDEDPVTGSAHCALAPYWAAKLGRQDLVGYQASRRGGRLRLRTEGARVKVAGQAVSVLRGMLAAGSEA
jgi:PhzF family phenazine biosynthesis protein